MDSLSSLFAAAYTVLMDMDNIISLFAGYTAIWIIFFGFVWRLQSRQKQLQQEIALLQQKLTAAQQERPA